MGIAFCVMAGLDPAMTAIRKNTFKNVLSSSKSWNVRRAESALDVRRRAASRVFWRLTP
jgi:hypothetical protein